MSSTITVLYPQPTDTAQFDSDYEAHVSLAHAKLPALTANHSVTRFADIPGMPPPYYLMFTARFDSMGDLQATMMAPEMREIGKDATRISTGGAPVILVGSEG